jgi:hypothetical protein
LEGDSFPRSHDLSENRRRLMLLEDFFDGMVVDGDECGVEMCREELSFWNTNLIALADHKIPIHHLNKQKNPLLYSTTSKTKPLTPPLSTSESVFCRGMETVILRYIARSLACNTNRHGRLSCFWLPLYDGDYLSSLKTSTGWDS